MYEYESEELLFTFEVKYEPCQRQTRLCPLVISRLCLNPTADGQLDTLTYQVSVSMQVS